MYKAKEIVLLRQWYFDKGEEINLESMQEAFQEFIHESELEVVLLGDEIKTGGALSNKMVNTLKICSANNAYMDVLLYTYMDKKIPLVEMGIAGKGEQIKAQDLATLYQKLEGAKAYIDNYRRIGNKFGSSVGAGSAVGAGIALMVSGGINLAVKGIKSLTRDKEAYEKEMEFYTAAIAMGDILIGGVESK